MMVGKTHNTAVVPLLCGFLMSGRGFSHSSAGLLVWEIVSNTVQLLTSKKNKQTYERLSKEIVRNTAGDDGPFWHFPTRSSWPDKGMSCAPLEVRLWWCVNAQRMDGTLHWDQWCTSRVGVMINHNFYLCAFHSEFRTAKACKNFSQWLFHMHTQNPMQVPQINFTAVGLKR